MNVLSLFDGMSCGQIALNRIGIKPSLYYAAEVDNHAITVTNDNYPYTFQMGDVTKWYKWPIDWASIDLVIGGSPCQGFSFAGKQLAFDDPRSKLFFVFLDILSFIKFHNPNVKFLLENVKMKKEHLAVITEKLGVDPVFINSSLVSAQNRQRYYWCNWEVSQPENKGLVLSNILQSGADLSDSLMSEGWFKWWDEKAMFQLGKKHSSLDTEKAICMTARQYASWNGNYITLDLESYFNETDEPLVFVARNRKKIHITRDCLNNPARTFYETRTELGKSARREAREKGLPDTTPRSPEHKKYVVQKHDKSNCLLATRSFLDCVIDNQYIIRALTPIECERLQNVPDNYTKSVNANHRYKMLGNGWTVDVIAHIFKEGLL